MNKRIQELAEKAGFRYIKDEGIGWAGNHNASLPRFAELIVRECAAFSRKSSKRIDDMGSLIARDIEKHFGVEE
jgi:hypothetical protein